MNPAQRVLFVVIGAAVAVSGWVAYTTEWDPFKIDVNRELPKWWYRTILVTNEDGKLNAYPEHVTMGKEDMLRWINPARSEFQIEFKDSYSPFEEWKLSTRKASTYQRPRTDTPLDEFEYSVIFGSDTLDPIIKVEEDPPPGGDSASVTAGG